MAIKEIKLEICYINEATENFSLTTWSKEL